MKITNIEYSQNQDASQICVVIRGEPNNNISYARFMQIVEELPKFLREIDKTNPLKILAARAKFAAEQAAASDAATTPVADDQVLIPNVALVPEPAAVVAASPAPVELPKQINVDEVIERKALLTVTGTLKGAFDPDKIAAAVVAAELPPQEPEPAVVAPPPVRVDCPPPMDTSGFDEEPAVPAPSREEELWARYETALAAVGKVARKDVLNTACEIWKSYKDEIKSFGEKYAGKASNSMTFAVHNALSIPEAEAFHLIRAALRGENPAIPSAVSAKPRMVSPAVQAPTPAAPVVAPTPVVVPASSELQANFMAKFEKQAVKDLKNALIVAATFAAAEDGGKLKVKKSALERVLNELNGCIPALADKAAVTAALDSSQMPIFCALQARGTWDKNA